LPILVLFGKKERKPSPIVPYSNYLTALLLAQSFLGLHLRHLLTIDLFSIFVLKNRHHTMTPNLSSRLLAPLLQPFLTPRRGEEKGRKAEAAATRSHGLPVEEEGCAALWA